MDEEIALREWAPLSEIINQIPIKVQTGLFSKYISITCIDVITEYLALGTNIGALFWYDRKLDQFEKFKCETCSEITCIQIVSTVDYMVACGQQNGQISIFQIPKSYPDTLPDSLKSHCTRKLERYTVTEIHGSPISSLEWATNGMKLFSGDKNGLVVLTELDFSMHICKELEIVNESYEIVQLSYCNQYLLISTTYRSVICYRQGDKWKVCQVGKKDRKNLGKFGGIFVKNGLKPTDIEVYCSRPGLRIWVADINGAVERTLLFKDLITSDIPEIPLLNPISNNLRRIKYESELTFGKLLYFNNKYLVTYESNVVYILDPENLVVIGSISRVRRVLSVACNKDEIFILEGDRSLIRISYEPEQTAEDTSNSIPQATLFLPISNSIKDFTSKFQSSNILAALPTLLEANPTITECSIETDNTAIVRAEEALESPEKEEGNESDLNDLLNPAHYVEKLKTNSQNLAQMVASLISNNDGPTTTPNINKSMYISKFESPRHVRTHQELYLESSEECLRKLEIFEKIGEQNYDSDILFKHSRRKKQKKHDDDSRMTNSYYTPELSPKHLQPLNLSMIELPTDFSLLKPDLRSPDSIQNDIKTKEKLLSDVLYYTSKIEENNENDVSESLENNITVPVTKVCQPLPSTTNGSDTKAKKVDKKSQMPVWVVQPIVNKPSSSCKGLLKRLKKKPSKSDDNARLTNYKSSYDPDDYLGPAPNFGLSGAQDVLTDGSDVSLTDWEIL